MTRLFLFQLAEQAAETFLPSFKAAISVDWDFTTVHINKNSMAGVKADLVRPLSVHGSFALRSRNSNRSSISPHAVVLISNPSSFSPFAGSLRFLRKAPLGHRVRLRVHISSLHRERRDEPTRADISLLSLSSPSMIAVTTPRASSLAPTSLRSTPTSTISSISLRLTPGKSLLFF